MASLDRKLIQALPVFSMMEEAELDHVIAHATAVRIAKNTAIFEQGQTATAFYVLLYGRLKVVQVTPDGQQVVIRFVSPGDIYGIAKALRRPDYPATAVAVVDSVTLAWNADIWDDFIARHPAFAANVMQMMGQRLQEAHSRVKEMSTEEVERRVAHAVVRLVEQSGRQVEDGVVVDFPITHQDIAQVAGTTLHSVSRVLSAWEGVGLVTVGRRKIVVRDLKGLARVAEAAGRGSRAQSRGDR
jgi:CRP-like cAMP-binding protein